MPTNFLERVEVFERRIQANKEGIESTLSRCNRSFDMRQTSSLGADTLYANLVAYYAKSWRASPWLLKSKDDQNRIIVLESRVYANEADGFRDFAKNLLKMAGLLISGKLSGPAADSQSRVRCTVKVTSELQTALLWDYEVEHFPEGRPLYTERSWRQCTFGCRNITGLNEELGQFSNGCLSPTFF
jgi:hypothetical protein